MNDQLLPQDFKSAEPNHPLNHRLCRENRPARRQQLATRSNTIWSHTDVRWCNRRRDALQRLSDVLPKLLNQRGYLAACWCWAYRTLRNWVRNLGVITVQQELLRGIAPACSNWFRPNRCDRPGLRMDTFAIVNPGGAPIQDCKPAPASNVVHDGLNLKAFQTSEGLSELRAGMALCRSATRKPAPTGRRPTGRVE